MSLLTKCWVGLFDLSMNKILYLLYIWILNRICFLASSTFTDIVAHLTVICIVWWPSHCFSPLPICVGFALCNNSTCKRVSPDTVGWLLIWLQRFKIILGILFFDMYLFINEWDLWDYPLLDDHKMNPFKMIWISLFLKEFTFI